MLLDADVQGDVISLRPPSQRVEEEDGLLVAALSELGLGVLEGEEGNEVRLGK